MFDVMKHLIPKSYTENIDGRYNLYTGISHRTLIRWTSFAWHSHELNVVIVVDAEWGRPVGVRMTVLWRSI